MANCTYVKSQGNNDVESIAKYKDEFVTVKAAPLKLSDNISMTLRFQIFLEYREETGEKWITSIVTLVDTVLGMTNDNDERDNYIYCTKSCFLHASIRALGRVYFS